MLVGPVAGGSCLTVTLADPEAWDAAGKHSNQKMRVSEMDELSADVVARVGKISLTGAHNSGT